MKLEKERLFVVFAQLVIAASYAIEAVFIPDERWLFVIALIWLSYAILAFRGWSSTVFPKGDLVAYGAISLICALCIFGCKNGFDYAQIATLLIYSFGRMFFAWKILKTSRVVKRTVRVPLDPNWTFKHMVEELVRKDRKNFNFEEWDVVVNGEILDESELQKPVWQMAEVIKEFDLVPKIKE